jgi:hypothetical protein
MRDTKTAVVHRVVEVSICPGTPTGSMGLSGG